MFAGYYTQSDGEHGLRDRGTRGHQEYDRQRLDHSRWQLYTDESVGHPRLRQDTALDAPQQQGSQRGRDRWYGLRLLRRDAGDYVLRAVEVSHGLTHAALSRIHWGNLLAASDRTGRYISGSRADEYNRARGCKQKKNKEQ